ncbi:methylenetetrahydrofolate reductase [NAD(P)H] [Kordiimonas marina]|uniref:methylenetetrahydrofolate reductase [NAD(P)H] n=1 Tax=Kordiimonas marina TaxID=2872312 RepID=UPI001FF6C2AE|nr:methylenetetrahydrofolate reductase [NAD(P)H] [Kordiimonas marina]MCJ9429379.1 methylenetetrahydrofolate reductase [NAD(P)H] [Kordiimonas marina]
MVRLADTIGRRNGGSVYAEPVEDVTFSFEFFPPKTPKMEETLWSSIKTLEALNPSFVSVTYGAGGTTRERTHKTVKRILDETPLKPAAHLTCVGASKDEVNEVVRDYYDAGVRHLVALRGDAPEGAGGYRPHPGGYANAAELVAGIRDIADFDISVAAYPERHPESGTLAADLDNLKRKIDAGATRAITQFFFEPDTYFRFLDHCHSYGIEVPIVPGILPVTNYGTLKSFAAACGASVPKWMGDLFEGLDDHPQTRMLVAASVASEMCRQLYAGGVRDFHFYTLNRAELTYAICRMLGYRAPAKQEA